MQLFFTCYGKLFFSGVYCASNRYSTFGVHKLELNNFCPLSHEVFGICRSNFFKKINLFNNTWLRTGQKLHCVGLFRLGK